MKPHHIELARTGRSRCRGCSGPIAKDTLRLGVAHAQENGSYSTQWLHLTCAATDRFLELEQALAGCTLPIPDRTVLEDRIEASKKKLPAARYPYAVCGPSLDTFLCAHCGAWSFPSTLRILSPVQITVGGKTLTRDAEIHHSCANAYFGDANLLPTVLANSNLDPSGLSWLQDGRMT